MKILLLTKYSRLGASSRLRALQYIPYLEDKGYNITVEPLFDDVYLEILYSSKTRTFNRIAFLYLKRILSLRNAKNYDVLWIEKELLPYMPPILERLLNIFNIPYIVDYDDAIFHNYDLSDNIVIRHFLSKKIDIVMKNAKCVTAGSSYLIERAKIAHAKKTKWIPTVIDLERYKIIAPTPNKNYNKTIGWIGSPYTQKYLLQIKEALNALNKKHSINLLLVGATDSIVQEFPDIAVTVVPWSENTETDYIRKMDIGIMPLSNTPWELGKCGYKLIQYMACGIPVVASPVGVNSIIVNNSKSGYLAENNEQWYICLDKLLRSSIRCETFGVSGRAAIDSIYSLQVQAPVLARIFNSIVKKGAF